MNPHNTDVEAKDFIFSIILSANRSEVSAAPGGGTMQLNVMVTADIVLSDLLLGAINNLRKKRNISVSGWRSDRRSPEMCVTPG